MWKVLARWTARNDIFISNLPKYFNTNVLKELLPSESKFNFHKGFCFVALPETANAKEFAGKINGMMIGENQVRAIVNVQERKKERQTFRKDSDEKTNLEGESGNLENYGVKTESKTQPVENKKVEKKERGNYREKSFLGQPSTHEGDGEKPENKNQSIENWKWEKKDRSNDKEKINSLGLTGAAQSEIIKKPSFEMESLGKLFEKQGNRENLEFVETYHVRKDFFVRSVDK